MITIGQTVMLKRGGDPLVVVSIANSGDKEHLEWGQLLLLRRDPSDLSGFFWEDTVEVVTR